MHTEIQHAQERVSMDDNFPFGHFLNIKEEINSEPREFKPEVISTPSNNNNKLKDSFKNDELKSITDEFKIQLQNVIPTQKYNTFFRDVLTVTNITDDSIEFTVTTPFIKKMIINHYYEALTSVCNLILGTTYKINVNVLNTTNTLNIPSENNEASETYSVKKASSVKETSFKIDGYTQGKEELIDQVNSTFIKHVKDNKFSQKIDKNKTFENFITGPSNNMAQAFAESVAKDPGGQYPQLYLYGNSGLGKTHLLNSICNYIEETQPNLRLCFTTANAFMTEMVLLIQDKRFEEFKRKYTEHVDVLIIDDIHELANKVRTQEEFFHIFNELQKRGKQLIFTSDKPPKDIDGIAERIKTRLTQALLIEIQQPDYETRMAILKKKALEKDIFLSDDVVTLIAKCIKTNIRELEGSLVKLGAYSDLMNVNVDLEIAKEQLRLLLMM
jgi:chromosomal replication initiator protein